MKKLTLGQQLMWGFGLIVAISVIVGLVQVWRMQAIAKRSAQLAEFDMPILQVATAIENSQREAGYQLVAYSYNRDGAWLQRGRAGIAEIDNALRELGDVVRRDEARAESLGVSRKLRDLSASLEDYKREVDSSERIAKSMLAIQEDSVRASQSFSENMGAYRGFQEEQMDEQVKKGDTAAELMIRLSRIRAVDSILADYTTLRVDFWRAYYSNAEDAALQTAEVAKKIIGATDSVLRETRQERNRVKLNAVKTAAESLQNCLTRFAELTREDKQVKERRLVAYRATLSAASELGLAARNESVAMAAATESIVQQSLVVVTVGVGAALVLGLGLAWVITRGLTRLLGGLVANLRAGSDQTASIASQVSRASQALAEGASEQAASLEETSASLEELSGMTKQNAESAGEADDSTR